MSSDAILRYHSNTRLPKRKRLWLPISNWRIFDLSQSSKVSIPTSAFVLAAAMRSLGEVATSPTPAAAAAADGYRAPVRRVHLLLFSRRRRCARKTAPALKLNGTRRAIHFSGLATDPPHAGTKDAEPGGGEQFVWERAVPSEKT